MSEDLSAAMRIAASGLNAQSTRMRIVSENLANAHSTGETPGADAYRRKTVSFAQELDRTDAVGAVRVNAIGVDRAPFQVEHRPGHIAADEAGYVKLPNVNPLIEMADMREADASYQANLQVVRQVREMVSGLIDLLRAR